MTISCKAYGLIARLIGNNSERVIIEYYNSHTGDVWKSLIPASKAESYRRPGPNYGFSKIGFQDMVNDDLAGLL